MSPPPGADGPPQRTADGRRSDGQPASRLAAVLDQFADAIIIASVDGDIRYVNPALERLSGYDSASLVGRHVLDVWSGPRERRLFTDGQDALVAGRAYNSRITGRREGGTPQVIDLSLSPLRSEEGAVAEFVGVARDVAYVAELERVLDRAQKLQAIGVLAGGIAHEMNNVLAMVAGTASLIRCDLSEDDAKRGDLDRILAAVKRGSALTKEVLRFARAEVCCRVAVSLNDVVRQALQQVKPRMPGTVTVDLRLDPQLPDVNADADGLRDVVVQLCLNAIEAMDHGGTLTLSTYAFERQAPGAEEEADPRLARKTETWVELRVSDDGRGMRRSTLEHAFEPFFSTKPTGKGAGLGLSLAYSIVRAHGGTIQLDSDCGRGTTVALSLPVGPATPQPAHADASTAPAAASPQIDNVTVLLVDDEETIRMVGRRMLERHGLRVLTAADGEEALRLFEAHQRDIDAIVLDVSMPVMSGFDCLRHIRELSNEVPVLLCSGYEERFLAQAPLPYPGVRMMAKPTDMQEFVDAVSQAIHTALKAKAPDTP